MSKNKISASILDREGHPDGMTVPAGFFESFAGDMAAKLPPNELEQQPVKILAPPTPWQRMRPFVYMAAMFAGIWCMMKMFSMIRQSDAGFSFDHNPAVTAAIDNDDFVFDYLGDDYTETDILEDLYADGFSVSDISY